MEFYNRKAVCAPLKEYCHLAKEHNFIEVTEWHNGEGFDVTIADDKYYSFTYGEFDLLSVLVKVEKP
jgi:hypothetical protein